MATLETSLARGPLFLLDRAEELGIDRSTLLAAARLDEEDLRDPDARVPIPAFVALWRALLESRPDPGLGLRFGAAMTAREVGLVGYLMMHSPDLETALRRLVRFCRILGETNRASLTVERGTGTFSWEPDSRLQAIPQTIDWILAAVLTVSEELTGSELRPLEVHYPHPKPATPGAVPGGGRTRARWDRERAALVLRASDLKRSVSAADSTLGSYLEKHAETVLRALPFQHSYSRRTRLAIWSQLREGEPTLDCVARELKIRPRTLQRRLNEEGSSFSELLDEVRRTLATSLLEDRSLGIHEIAFLLGYSEPSAFYRAFRRWQQVSPSAFRAAAAG